MLYDYLTKTTAYKRHDNGIGMSKQHRCFMTTNLTNYYKNIENHLSETDAPFVAYNPIGNNPACKQASRQPYH